MIKAKLPACLETWWTTHGNWHGGGLVRQVETRLVEGGDGLLAKVALRPGKAAVGITSASYDPGRGRVTLVLDDGRSLSLAAGQHIEEAEEWWGTARTARCRGASRSALHGASPEQLQGLRASGDGAYLVVEVMELHVSVDGLVTRIMEASPQAIRQSGARLAGLATSPAKAAASARNGRLGGRPKGRVSAQIAWASPEWAHVLGQAAMGRSAPPT